MTPKQKLKAFVDRVSANASMEELLGKLELFHAVEIGSVHFSRGEFKDHDELFDELLASCDDDIRSFEQIKDVLEKVKKGKMQSVKEQMACLAERLDRSATHDQVIYQVEVLKNAADQVAARRDTHPKTRSTKHEEDQMVTPSAGKSQGNEEVHQPKRSKNGKRVHPTSQKVRKGS